MHNNILQRIETHMYEQVFSPDKENDERSFDEICDEALKLFKSQCDNIHFKAIDDRDVELLSDDNGHNKYNVNCRSLEEKQVIKWLTKSFLVKQECRIQKGDSD